MSLAPLSPPPDPPAVDLITLEPLDADPARRVTLNGNDLNAASLLESLVTAGEPTCPFTRKPLTGEEVAAVEAAAEVEPGYLAEAIALARKRAQEATDANNIYMLIVQEATGHLRDLDHLVEARGPLQARRRLFIAPPDAESLRLARVRHHRAASRAASSCLPLFSCACANVAKFASDRYEEFCDSARGMIQVGTTDPDALAAVRSVVEDVLAAAPGECTPPRYTVAQSVALAASSETEGGVVAMAGSALDRQALLWIISPGESSRPVLQDPPLFVRSFLTALQVAPGPTLNPIFTRRRPPPLPTVETIIGAIGAALEEDEG